MRRYIETHYISRPSAARDLERHFLPKPFLSHHHPGQPLDPFILPADFCLFDGGTLLVSNHSSPCFRARYNRRLGFHSSLCPVRCPSPSLAPTFSGGISRVAPLPLFALLILDITPLLPSLWTLVKVDKKSRQLRILVTENGADFFSFPAYPSLVLIWGTVNSVSSFDPALL